jgi:hypothetical protein
LLANDVLVFEPCNVERGKAEYAAHHLAAGFAISQDVPATCKRGTGSAINSMACIASVGRTTVTTGARQ